MLLLLVRAGFAQNYSIEWSSIDGGGGASAGGNYSVSGTIGQTDCGTTLSGGGYTVDGGFWSMLSALQSPGAPLLEIRLTSTNTVAISWPSPFTGFALYENMDLNSAHWTLVEELIEDDGTRKTVIIDPPGGNRLYRLLQP